jgi:hypothetical protein
MVALWVMCDKMSASGKKKTRWADGLFVHIYSQRIG